MVGEIVQGPEGRRGGSGGQSRGGGGVQSGGERATEREREESFLSPLSYPILSLLSPPPPFSFQFSKCFFLGEVSGGKG